MRTTLFVASVVMASGMASACRIEQAEHLAARGPTVEARAAVDRFRASARRDLEEIDARIQQLMALADSATGPRRAELADLVQDFQTRSGDMEERLRALAWNDERMRQRTTNEIHQTLQALRGDVLAALATRIAADPAPHP